MKRLSPVLLLLGACVKIPSALMLEPTQTATSAPIVPTDEATTLAAMLNGDPLARRVRLPTVASFESVAWGAPYAAAATAIAEAERSASPDLLLRLEADWNGTAAVALARGVAAGRIEEAFSRDRAAREVALMLGPLAPAVTGASTDDATTLDWLGPVAQRRDRALMLSADRVLAGWLSGPSVPAGPVIAALDGQLYDGLRERPLARALVARSAPPQPSPAALEALERATNLALQRSAADRDREQAAWAKARDAASAEVGGVDPVKAWLDRAFDAALTQGGDPTATGAALVADAARRWDASCHDIACLGLDRVGTLARGDAWGAEPGHFGDVWVVIALNDALKTMDVAQQSVLYPIALPNLIDAVVGSGGAPLPVDLLERRKPDEATWLAIGRSLGEPGATDWPGARHAIGQHLARIARAAAAEAPEGDRRTQLTSIADRAAP